MRTTLTLLLLCGGQAFATPVEQIDWKNRVYTHGELGKVQVKNGSWEVEPKGDDDVPQSLTIGEVLFADLDGDGSKEAIVSSVHWGGGTGQFDAVDIYRATPKGVEVMGQIPGGDRGDGGIVGLKVEGKTVVLGRMTSLEGDGACCPSMAFEERWSWRGGKMWLDEDKTIAKIATEQRVEGDFGGKLKAARAALKRKAYDEAVERFREALTLKPKHALAWSEFGFTLMLMGDWAAPRVLRYANQLEVKPKRKAAGLFNLGKAYMNTKDYAEAVKAYEGSLALRPDNAATTKALAAAREALAQKKAKP